MIALISGGAILTGAETSHLPPEIRRSFYLLIFIAGILFCLAALAWLKKKWSLAIGLTLFAWRVLAWGLPDR